ncbi:MAG: hypothetical protein OXC40_00235, partial [Proteobacteria bacterium]|nr:hypothetical protein [Pseudomonadota bacterium]
IDHVLVPVSTNYIIRGLFKTADNHHKAKLFQGDNLASHFLFDNPNRLKVKTTSAQNPSSQTVETPFASYYIGAFTLFALTANQKLGDPLKRFEPRRDLIKVDLSSHATCLALYQNAAQTDFPVILVLSY